MFKWLFGKDVKNLEEKTEKSFSAVKKDMDAVGKWIKHLDIKDKQLFDILNEIKLELASVKDEVESLREAIKLVEEPEESKQVFKKTGVYDKQTAVLDVEDAVQTPVQTANFYDNLKNLSKNEREIIYALLSSDMKLSYEDLAMILGKERSTVRGQINTIRQKNEGLILEMTEKSGKKRVYLPEEIKEKLAKYAKVRVGNNKKVRVNTKSSDNSQENVENSEK